MTSSTWQDRDDDGDFVTVARRFDPIAAELLRGRLAADGIPARLADVHLVQTYSLWAAALGGVRVMVPASWAPQAMRAIAAVEKGELALEDAGSTGDESSCDAQVAEGPGRIDDSASHGRRDHGLHLAAGATALLLLLAVASALGA
jgi:hypothetical protein